MSATLAERHADQLRVNTIQLLQLQGRNMQTLEANKRLTTARWQHLRHRRVRARATMAPRSSSRSRWPPVQWVRHATRTPPRTSHGPSKTGELSVLVNDQWRTLGAGESLTIPPGTVHTLANRSATTVRFHDAHRPALDFQEYIEDLDRLTRAGKLTARMTPRTLIYGAMVLVDAPPDAAHRQCRPASSRVRARRARNAARLPHPPMSRSHRRS